MPTVTAQGLFVPMGMIETRLGAEDEASFRQWVAQNNIPFDPDGSGQDYDMRGFWRGLQAGDPRAATGVDPSTGELHFTDSWKMPWHETASRESIYATQGAPRWSREPAGPGLFRDILRMTDGSVVFSSGPYKEPLR
jgi:hypothetical protein